MKEKCQLGKAQVEYLGRVTGGGSQRPLDEKIHAIQEFPRPITKTNIWAFLGLSGYYHCYISNYSEIASLLTDGLRKTKPIRAAWNEAKESPFVALKRALMSKPVLRDPDYDRPFIVHCYASNRGIGQSVRHAWRRAPCTVLEPKADNQGTGIDHIRKRMCVLSLGHSKAAVPLSQFPFHYRDRSLPLNMAPKHVTNK